MIALSFRYKHEIVCLNLATPWTIAHQASLSMEFPRQEYWSGLTFPPSGDLSNLGYRTHISCIAGGFFTTRATREYLSI